MHYNLFRACFVLLALSIAQSARAQTTVEGNAPPDYVGTAACAECHAAEYENWTGSHHDLAWTDPTPDNVLGDFNDVTFTHRGVTTTFSREGDTFFIESDGPDGKLTKWPVAGVIGITPLQQYFVETEPGRFQTFDIPWDTIRKEWFHMYPDAHLPASDAFHWSGPYKTWNNRCAECHATDYRRNYDVSKKSYTSTYSEMGVGCEACHGPGEAHLAWAEAESRPADWPWKELSDRGFTIDFTTGERETQMQQCAACHSRRSPLQDGAPLPGTPFHDAYRLSTLRTPLYEADGQILDEVYVYGSFLQSKMYEKGVACSDCHDVHSGERYDEGNGVCLTCHSPAGNPDFPSLKLADYDTPDHHFHPEGSEGALCKSCHMIERIYMGVDGRRDHSFRVPRPDLSIATGAPNACTDCHADKGPYWAQAELDKRFPNSAYRGPHFATTLAAAWKGDSTAAGDLAEIALSELPGIVRATALETLAPMATPELAERVAALLEDADPMVRANAVTVQRAAPAPTRVQRLLPLLTDERRVVRQAAAREFLAAPIAHMPDKQAEALRGAMGEWQQTLAATTDFPETQMALGGMALTMRNLPAALAAFREAVRLDPQMVRAWSMVVRLEAAAGRETEARAALEDALTLNPYDPGLQALRSQLP